MIVHKKTGGRIVELFVPFEILGKKIDAITISPLMLDHVLRWQKGAWKESLDLLTELSCNGPNDFEQQRIVLQHLRYPDADRVLTAFFEMLPPEIQSAIARGEIPNVAADEVGPSMSEPEPAPQSEKIAATEQSAAELVNPIGFDLDEPPSPLLKPSLVKTGTNG